MERHVLRFTAPSTGPLERLHRGPGQLPPSSARPASDLGRKIRKVGSMCGMQWGRYVYVMYVCNVSMYVYVSIEGKNMCDLMWLFMA